jgi:3-oxoacyl-[acyl-carrier-protein] synthase II
MPRRAVITGIGLVSCLATGTEATWKAIIAGRSGIGPITRFDASEYDARIAGEVRDFQPEAWLDRKDIVRLDPFMQYALAAAKMALADSGIEVTPEIADRIGCLVGSGIGGITTLEAAHQKLLEKGPSRVSALLVPQVIINLAPGQIAIHLGLRGPNWSPVSACASGAHAVGEAMRIIQRGEADAVIAGGAEAPVTPLMVASLAAAKALCCDRNGEPENACRPFERDRSGAVISEGAGILVVEELEHARRRGARIWAEIVGYGATCDAFHITQPSPGGEGAARCMRLALEDAKMSPERIAYINAHGTSTPLNDIAETTAIKAVFGAHAQELAVSSTKSMIGHQLGAAGSTEAAITALALHHGLLPPTINYVTPDRECDLDYVPNEARAARADVAMSNSFGFGGTNAVLVLERFA